MVGLIRIETLLKNVINASQCCQLAFLTHSEMGLCARFKCFYLYIIHHHTCAHQMNISTTTETETQQGQGEIGVLHLLSK